MKNLKPVFILMFATLILSSASAQTIPDGYNKVVNKFKDAITASDAATISDLFTPNAVTQEMGGQVLKGPSAVREYYTQLFNQTTYTNPEINVEEVTMLAPNVYFGRGTFTANLVMKANGQEMPAKSYWSNISMVEDGEWKIERHMIAIPSSRQ